MSTIANGVAAATMFEAAPANANSSVAGTIDSPNTAKEPRKRAVLMIKKRRRTRPGNLDTHDMLQSSGKLPSSIHDSTSLNMHGLKNTN